MILDKLSEFCDATSIISTTGLAHVGSAIDLGLTDRDIGNGCPLYLVIQVTTTVDSSGDAATVEFQLVSDASSTMAADASETLHFSTGAIAEASLAAGWEEVYALPTGLNTTYERYLGLQTNVGTEATTAGAINAFLTMDPYGWRAYPEGNN